MTSDPLTPQELAAVAQRIDRKAENITDRRRLVAAVKYERARAEDQIRRKRVLHEKYEAIHAQLDAALDIIARIPPDTWQAYTEVELTVRALADERNR